MKTILATIGCMLFSVAVHATGGETRTQEPGSTAEIKKFGAYVALGNPYPTLLGVNGAYNIDDHLRASVGYGEVEVTTGMSFDANGITEKKMKAETYSAGMDYLFLESTLRPVIGGRVGYFHVSGDGTFNIQGIEKSTALIYSNVGLDWLTRGGFNMGTGLNVALLGGHGANLYANIGYFF